MTSRSDADQAALQNAIADERSRTQARIESLRHDFNDIVAASEDANTDDEHDPEGATIAFERQQIASLIALSETRLGQLDQALEELAEGTYGTCELCGQPIPIERLQARPTAKRCVDCASR